MPANHNQPTSSSGQRFTSTTLANFAPGKTVTVQVTGPHGGKKSFHAAVRIDTPQELQYYRHGGILQFVLRQLLEKK